MGYNTDFYGSFNINRKVDRKTLKLVSGICVTRRMKRDMSKLFPNMSKSQLERKYGKDGEFYVDGVGGFEEFNDPSIVDVNLPPGNQPGTHCDWNIYECEGSYKIGWNGNEKSYDMDAWIKYLIDRIFAPRGYVLNGTVTAYGEDHDDIWRMVIVNNNLIVQTGRVVFE